MDAEFFRAFAKDKTISRAEFNKKFLSEHKKTIARNTPADRFATLTPVFNFFPKQ
jgi:hypothetical protein